MNTTSTQVTGMLKSVVKYATYAAQIQTPQRVPDAAVAYLVTNLSATEVVGVNKHLCRMVDEALDAGHLHTDKPELLAAVRTYRLRRAA